jgi:protein-S-isoprenylcysteine O-methyltransferase Ste14
MRPVELVFAVGWAAFWLYWLVGAFSMKRGRVPWSRELRIRAVIVVVAILLIRLGVFRGHGLNTDPWRAGIGLVLFTLGLGFAIWARMHLGRNWGTPMTQKDEPELVMSGPYHLVRHPIYSGILVAGLFKRLQFALTTELLLFAPVDASVLVHELEPTSVGIVYVEASRHA